MARLSAFLRLPRWLERAWQDTVIELEDPSSPPHVDPQEADTVPLPLHGALVPRQ